MLTLRFNSGGVVIQNRANINSNKTFSLYKLHLINAKNYNILKKNLSYSLHNVYIIEYKKHILMLKSF